MLGMDMISETLAPILLVSATGLLILGLGNRMGRITDRIRKFNDEVRNGTVSESRWDIIQAQKDTLIRRLKLCRNAMLQYHLTILFTSISSIMVFLKYFDSCCAYGAVLALAMALMSLFAGSVYAVREIMLSYVAVLKEASFYLEEKSGVKNR